MVNIIMRERNALDPLYSTVFVWVDISINIDKQNEIKAAAYFAGGTIMEDVAL